MYRGLANALLPAARKQIRIAFADTQANEKSEYKDLFIKETGDEIIIKELYENYTSALGMIVNQSGFQTAIAIYSPDEKNKSEGNRQIILTLLFEILKQEGFLDGIFKDFRNNILNGEYLNQYEELFKEGSIALKRAFRTYKIKKETHHDNK
jgi:hypothetical protein